MSFISRGHLLSAHDITRDELDEVFAATTNIEQRLRQGTTADILRGKILATLFFEPSTRTRFSFESAMLQLGGQVISMESGRSSSQQKGESLEDTGRIVSCYAQLMVIRHPEVGSAHRIATNATIPVINAGDGSNQHPTQALLDLYTIKKEKGHLHGLTVGVFGDLLFGRAAHSLINLLAQFQTRLVMVAPESLMPPAEILEELKSAGIEYLQTTSLDEVVPLLDVLYCTRVQQERFPSPEAYAAVKNSYQLTQAMMVRAKATCIILHPLPRTEEISRDLDLTPQAHYFTQAQNGVYVRMAILSLLCRRY